MAKELGFYSLIRPIIVGITLVLLSDGVMQYANDLEGIGAILFSVFVITIASF